MARKGNFRILDNYSHYVPGVGDLVVLMLMLLLGAVVGNVASLLMLKIPVLGGKTEFATLISYALMFIPPLLYASTMSHLRSVGTAGVKLDSSHFGEKGGLLCTAIALVSVFASGFCADAFTQLLPAMPEKLKEILETMVEGNFWVNLLCVAVLAPFCEEWLCRGMILRGLLRHNVKAIWAIPISALVFAFIHLNPWQAIPAFILGLLFGYFYYKTGSLRLTMLMHCANNAFALILGHIDSLKDIDSWMEVMEPARYWVLFAACLILTVLAVLTISRIPQEDEQGNFDTSASQG